jgi:hypothetical protein
MRISRVGYRKKIIHRVSFQSYNFSLSCEIIQLNVLLCVLCRMVLAYYNNNANSLVLIVTVFSFLSIYIAFAACNKYNNNLISILFCNRNNNIYSFINEDHNKLGLRNTRQISPNLHFQTYTIDNRF